MGDRDDTEAGNSTTQVSARPQQCWIRRPPHLSVTTEIANCDRSVVVDLVARSCCTVWIGVFSLAHLLDYRCWTVRAERGEEVGPVVDPEGGDCPGGSVGQQDHPLCMPKRTAPVRAWLTTAGSAAATQKPPGTFRAASSACFIRTSAAAFSGDPWGSASAVARSAVAVALTRLSATMVRPSVV